MDTTIRKRSVTIAGHSTSVSLEAAFWDALKDIAAGRNLSINALIEQIDLERIDRGRIDGERIDGGRTGNLSSAIRVYVLAEALNPSSAKTEPCPPT
jgi:predicted DNA-binding ribbon-helix-helix protein